MRLSNTTRTGKTQTAAAAQPLRDTSLAREPVPRERSGAFWRGTKRLLEVELEVRRRIAFVRLHGSAGITEAAAVRVALENLVRQGIEAIVVDLGDLHYVASVAIAAIAAGLCRAEADRDRVRLAAPSADVRDVLNKSRAARSMRIYPSVAAAAAAGSSLSDRAAPGPRQTQGGHGAGAGHPMRIVVHGDAQERLAPVRVRIGRGGALKRLEARLLGIEAAGAPAAEVA